MKLLKIVTIAFLAVSWSIVAGLVVAAGGGGGGGDVTTRNHQGAAIMPYTYHATNDRRFREYGMKHLQPSYAGEYRPIYGRHAGPATATAAAPLAAHQPFSNHYTSIGVALSAAHNRPQYLPGSTTHATVPSEIAKYRLNGNYYQTSPTSFVPSPPDPTPSTTTAIAATSASSYSDHYPSPPVQYHLNVLHVEPDSTVTPIYQKNDSHQPLSYGIMAPEVRQRQSPPVKGNKSKRPRHLRSSTKTKSTSGQGRPLASSANVWKQVTPAVTSPAPTGQTEQRYHDIYMRYNAPQNVAFGYVERRPELFEKRFETQNDGNRYKGEVIWADQTGGYGEHRWNMVQGKL